MNPYEAPQSKSAAASPSRPSATLGELTIQQSATVSAINGTDSVSARLLEMGLVPGTTVKLIGKAPLGDPLEFELRGFRLSLRKTEAQRVCVEVV